MSKKPDSSPSKKRGPKRSPRRQAAEAAGMSRSQMWRCMQVGNIPDDEFEAWVESDNPPTVTELVEYGSRKRRKPETKTLRSTDTAERVVDKLRYLYDADTLGAIREAL